MQVDAIDLRDTVAGIGSLIDRMLGEKIELETDLPGTLWSLSADQSQLENALINILINSRDAMPNGGKIVIKGGNSTLSDERGSIPPGDYVRFSIADTGFGMSPDVLQNIFNPFFTTKDAGKGTGLGLSMVHGFVKQSGGHITIYSEAGHGTIVRLYLPLVAASDAEAQTPPAAGPNAGGSETILVVEDDALVRAAAVTSLGDLGHNLIEAADGPEAKTILDTGVHVDLLFTDVVMPGGMTGRMLADEAVRERPQLRVLYTSGYTDNTIVHHGRLDPGVHFLSKPYRLRDLAQRVRQVLDEYADAPRLTAQGD
jgi:CheY-like chemotaxis protein